jgi:hypothetical protein
MIVGVDGDDLPWRGGQVNVSRKSWSPDGRWIVFTKPGGNLVDAVGDHRRCPRIGSGRRCDGLAALGALAKLGADLGRDLGLHQLAGDKLRFPVGAPIYAGRSRRAAARSGNTLATLAVR